MYMDRKLNTLQFFNFLYVYEYVTTQCIGVENNALADIVPRQVRVQSELY